MDLDVFDLFIDVFGLDDWGLSVYLMGIFKLLEKKFSIELSFKFFGKFKDVKGFFKCGGNDELGLVKYVEMRRDYED